MKTLVIIAALLGTLLADDNVDVSNEGNVGSNVHQTVNINNQNHVATINSLNGWDSWDSICDYGRGVFATRLYGKRMCVVTKIDKTVFPSLEDLSTASRQKPLTNTKTLFKYSIDHKVPIANIGVYGVHVEALCRGIPSYPAEVIQVDEYFADCNTKNTLNIGGSSYCF